MTKHEVIPQLIEHYYKALGMVKKCSTVDEAHDITNNQQVFAGICWCSKKLFGNEISESGFVEYFLKKGNEISHSEMYWGTRPTLCYTLHDTIDCLQARIDIMEIIMLDDEIQ